MNAAHRTLPLILIFAAFAVCQALTGGTSPVFALPVYAFIATAGLLASGALRRLGALSGCLRATGVFALYLVVRAAFSPVPYLARADIFLILGCVLIYLLTVAYITTAGQRLLVVQCLLALACVHSLVGVVQAAQGEEFMLFGFAFDSAASSLMLFAAMEGCTVKIIV